MSTTRVIFLACLDYPFLDPKGEPGDRTLPAR